MNAVFDAGPAVQIPEDPDPWQTDLDGFVLPELARLMGGAPEKRKQKRWVRGSELLAMEFPGADWLIRGLISKESITIIGADPKASKTWTLVDLALAISAGGRAMGEFPSLVPPSPVALFLNEDGQRSVKNRIRALSAGYDYEPDRTWNIHTQTREPLDLGDMAQVAAFIADVRAITPKPVMLGIDPLRNVHDAEESSSTEMRPILRALGAIRQLCGCAVVVVHHAAKAGKDDRRTGGARLRGSSAIDGFRDGLISLEETEKSEDGQEISNRVVVDLKAYRGAGRFGLSLKIEDDENGEAIKATWTKADDVVSAVKSEADAGAQKERLATIMLGQLRQEATRAAMAGEQPQPLPITPLYKAAAESGRCRPLAAKGVLDGLVSTGKVLLVPLSNSRQGCVLGAQ